MIFKIQYSWKIWKFLNLFIKSDLQDTIRKFLNLITLHSLTGKYRFFTGISLWSISTATCFGCVQGLKGQISLKCREIYEFYTGISISYLHSCLCFYNRDFPVLWNTTTWRLQMIWNKQLRKQFDWGHFSVKTIVQCSEALVQLSSQTIEHWLIVFRVNAGLPNFLH